MPSKPKQGALRERLARATLLGLEFLVAADIIACTAAAHRRLVHQPMGDLLPSLVAGAPVAYGAMRLIHFVAASDGPIRNAKPLQRRGHAAPPETHRR